MPPTSPRHPSISAHALLYAWNLIYRRQTQYFFKARLIKVHQHRRTMYLIQPSKKKKLNPLRSFDEYYLNAHHLRRNRREFLQERNSQTRCYKEVKVASLIGADIRPSFRLETTSFEIHLASQPSAPCLELICVRGNYTRCGTGCGCAAERNFGRYVVEYVSRSRRN